MEHLNEMDSDLQQTMSRVQEGNNRIAALELGVKVLKTKAEQLRRNASDIQSKDVEGKNKYIYAWFVDKIPTFIIIKYVEVFDAMASQMQALSNVSLKNCKPISSCHCQEEISAKINWAASSEFGTYRLCEQRRFRRACASAQSRQNLRCSLIQAGSQEEPSGRKPDP